MLSILDHLCHIKDTLNPCGVILTQAQWEEYDQARTPKVVDPHGRDLFYGLVITSDPFESQVTRSWQ